MWNAILHVTYRITIEKRCQNLGVQIGLFIEVGRHMGVETFAILLVLRIA